MSTFRQLVPPNTGVQTGAGWCLAFTQAVYSAPVMHATAKIASQHVTRWNDSRVMPNVSVPVWFDHWGTYGGVYGNFGHVLAWVPGRGFLSSPRWGYGQEWFQTLEQVEQAYNGRFLFWSLDINTKLVAENAPSPEPAPPEPEPLPTPVTTRKGKKMFLCYFKDAAGKGKPRWAFFGPGLWFELKTKEAVIRFKAQNGIPEDVHSFDCGTQANWERFQRVTGLPKGSIEHV